MAARPRFGNPCPGYGLTVAAGVFGAPRTGHSHAGWDYTAPVGAPCRASAAGTVKRVSTVNTGAAGLLVELDHGAGWTTFGCHLSVVLVKVGDRLRAGDVYGKVGQTGNAVGPHLHAEWRLWGKAVDPALVVEGDEAVDVLKVQRRLVRHGYSPGTVDGLWGPATAAAVAAFQGDRGLDTTGLPNAWTVGLLLRPPGKAVDE